MTMIRSLEEHGQLQPIGLTPEYKLVFGERRLRAAKEMGWQYIEAIVKDRRELLEELAENTDRLEFSPIELVNIGREIEGDIEAEAKERQVEGAKKGSGNLPEANESAGDTRDQVAKLLGTSGTR
jgi:ParB/RepB/Spo0J family partition protein